MRVRVACARELLKPWNDASSGQGTGGSGPLFDRRPKRTSQREVDGRWFLTTRLVYLQWVLLGLLGPCWAPRTNCSAHFQPEALQLIEEIAWHWTE